MSSACELKAVFCVPNDTHCTGASCGGERSSENSWSKLSTGFSLPLLDDLEKSWRATGVGGVGD